MAYDVRARLKREQSQEGPSLREKFVTYGTKPSDREPLIRFMVDALRNQGCRIIHVPQPNVAPFRITFETPQGERLGVIAYAFLANNNEIKHRPADEHRFQIKYGGDLSGLHEIWQDPYGLYVTLLVGINPKNGFFVAADSVLRNPTRFSVSVEFKDKQVEAILQDKWVAWERERRPGKKPQDEPLFEVLVGGTSDQFLRLIRFEREAWGEEPGERHYLAEHFVHTALVTASRELVASSPMITPEHLHSLAKEFALPERKVLDLISERRMLKMAVRGSVAEEHLVNALQTVPGVQDCHRLEDDRGPDVALTFQGRRVTVECKNSSRVRTKEGYEKIDLQRTRASKSDPCSRYYKPSEFDLVAACIHAVTEKWEFKYASTKELDAHGTCVGRLSNNVKLDRRWTVDASAAISKSIA
jgi:hypothetical protein